MVLLTATPRILHLISTIPSASLSSISSPDLPDTPGAPISHTTLLTIFRLANALPNASSHATSLNSLLHGARPYVPPPQPKPAKSPQYVALMARLKAEQDQRQYRTLVSRQIIDDTTDQLTGEKDDISPSLVVNILLSIVMCTVAIFIMTRYWRNDGIRVLVSLGAGLVVGVAEVGMYSIYLRKVRMGKEKERKLKEKKFIIEREEIGGKSLDDDGNRSIEGKEEIWGRGKHGGMRRRVREKWEKEQDQEDTTS